MSAADNRLAIAAECLRQIWQEFDAGGVSHGRSRRATLLETAMELIDYDHRFSELADSSPGAFDAMREEERHAAGQERSAAWFAEMDLKENKKHAQ